LSVATSCSSDKRVSSCRFRRSRVQRNLAVKPIPFKSAIQRMLECKTSSPVSNSPLSPKVSRTSITILSFLFLFTSYLSPAGYSVIELSARKQTRPTTLDNKRRRSGRCVKDKGVEGRGGERQMEGKDIVNKVNKTIESPDVYQLSRSTVLIEF